MPRFDGAIFDLDGTLIDSLADIAHAANRTLEHLGKPVWPIEAYKQFVGDGVNFLFHRALPETVEDAELLARCVAVYKQEYERSWDNLTKPYPGIPEMLEACLAHGLKLAVFSNKPHPFTQACVERFFPAVPFSHVVGQGDRFPKKPDPSGAIWIASQITSQSHRIAYVGDTNTDMKTATGANLFAIGVAWGFRDIPEIREAGAQEICHTADQLKNLLVSRRA